MPHSTYAQNQFVSSLWRVLNLRLYQFPAAFLKPDQGSAGGVFMPVNGARQAHMDGRHHYWYDRLTDEKILGPLPEPPSFPEAIALVRNRIRKSIGKVSVPRAMTVRHPAIARLIAQDEVRRQKQAAATYAFSWDAPVFDGPFEQRRLRILNALFLALARCGGKAEVRGREAREMSITVHQIGLAISLDRPPARRGKGAGQEAGGPDRLRLAILGQYDRDQVRASWQDGEEGRLEGFILDIAVEVVTSAEISYRENCVRAFEWRVQRKAKLEEEARQHKLQLECEARERQQQLEQARIDRLLDEAGRCDERPTSALMSMP